MGFGTKLALVLGGVILYFLPCYLALERHHPKRRLICLIDLLAGWTVVGWVVAMVMALSGPRKSFRALDDYYDKR